MLPYGSASALPLFMKCPAAAVLPHTRNESDAANEGSAVHDHLQIRASHGVDEAMAAMPSIVAKRCLTAEQARGVVATCRAFEWSPPAGSLGEVALVYMRDRTVQRVKGGQGRYELPDGGLIPGTSDLLWCEVDGEPVPFDMSDPTHPKAPPGAVLWCVDYKTGQDRHVTPIEWNAQALFNTMTAARWVGARYAIPAILYVRPGKGEWDVPVNADGSARVLGPRDLDALEESVRTFVDDADEQRRHLTAGEPLTYVEGRHCRYCAASWVCDAKSSLMRRVADRGVRLPRAGEPLSADQATFLAEHVGFFEAFAARVREVLKEHVDQAGAIDLPDGDAWGRIEKPRTTIDGKRALAVLREEIGGGDAAPIAELGDRVTKTEIMRAIEGSVRARRYGRPGAIFGRVMRRLEALGAIGEEVRVEYGVFRPKPVPSASGMVVEDLDAEVVL